MRGTFEMRVEIKGWLAGKGKSSRDVIKGGLRFLADLWHSEYFPKRFQPSGTNIYKLKERQPKYVRNSKKNFPSWRPLYRTGNMFMHMKNNVRHKVVVNNNKAFVKTTMKRPHATQAYVAQELVRVNENEKKALLSRFYSYVRDRLFGNNIKGKKAA